MELQTLHRSWQSWSARRTGRHRGLPQVAANRLPVAETRGHGSQGEPHDAHRRRSRPAWPPRPPGSGTPRPSSTRTRSRAFVREQLAGLPVRRAQRLRAGARRRPAPARCRCCSARCTARCTGGSRRLTVLVALGTHAPMSEEALAAHLGYAPGRARRRPIPARPCVNHEWWEPGDVRRPRHDPGGPDRASCPRAGWTWTCRCCSTARSSSTTSRWSSARCCRTRSSASPAATSTSSPASRGQKIIDVSHWLGALITSAEIIGTTGITPVRALIDDGAALIPSEKLAFCVVTAEVADGAADGAVDAAVTAPVRTSGLHSVSFGDTRRVVGGGGRGLRGHPRDLPRRAGPPGAVDRPRRCTTRSGPAPRASTSWSPWSPTAAR